jgi:murein DD-endopeptidase MepM/ murein hydrolase activator NlpD
MRRESYTLMIVGDAHREVRRHRLEYRHIRLAFLVAVLVFVSGAAITSHGLSLLGQPFDSASLRAENQTLEERLLRLRAHAAAVEDGLRQIDDADRTLRRMADLPAPSPNLALGPVSLTPSATGGATPDIDPFAVPLDAERLASVRDIDESRLSTLGSSVARARSSLEELVGYFTERNQLLSSTPSVWPTRGWITSEFGWREDPFTSGRVMHAGIDLAAPEGTQVVAPASGTVVYAGEDGGYGRMITIDHGRGITTNYGHLSRVLVKVGDTVSRGQHIGAVGNTGRSTGPHLHYEVRQNGIPISPRAYVLER